MATNNESNADNGGRFQNFAKGSSIYWKENVSAGVANQIGGLIRDKWGSLDWERSFLKYPTSRELPARKPGRFNRFQNGSIYWAQGAASAYVIVGGGQIEQTWAANDWENGFYGFPTSDEYDFEGGKKQDFQNGSIVWKPEGFPEDWEGDITDGGTDYSPECDASTACGFDARGGPKIAPQKLNTPTPVPPRAPGARTASTPCLTEVATAQAPQTSPPAPATTSLPRATTSTPSTTAPSTPQESQAPASTDSTTSSQESTSTSPNQPGATGRTPAATSTTLPPTTGSTTPQSTATTTPEPTTPSSSTPAPGTIDPPAIETPTDDAVWCRGQGETAGPSASVSRAVETTMCTTRQDAWWASRRDACFLDNNAAIILKNVDGNEDGRIEGVEAMSVTPTSYNATTFRTDYSFRVTDVQDGAVNSIINLEHFCLLREGGSGNCTSVGAPDSQTGLVHVGDELTLSSTFSVPVGAAGSGAVKAAQAMVRLTVAGGASGRPFSQEIQTARVRCDSQTRMRNTTGCIIADTIPVWDLGGYPTLDQYRNHVSLGQQSGLPGFSDNSGFGVPLTRTTNTTTISSNRRTTCGGVTGPRTGGRSCDEYPMAATTQGGGGGVGRTFALTDTFCGIRDTGVEKLGDPPAGRGPGYSVCLIDRGQNSRAGSLQGWFFTKSRVIATDNFLIRPN